LGPGEGVGAWQVDVIVDNHEAALGEFFLMPPARAVGEDGRLSRREGKNSNGESDGPALEKAFVEMARALHSGDFDAINHGR